ncbi:peroxiredoxin-like family protein [Halobacteriovorax sp. JY17]|uniref:peroxiredoxin-like family protein n=1 Tax=Halobacteriovorax sp. JY17 TaxID=2014617 RepID=UPI000C60AE4A|nr:peroxiredoxin-like family protein [Halobacteriovorax sp. JY17]PIK16246.1 MAG: antioxidant AhpC [Halobacteriovorax sp. JY17]
MRFLVLLGLLFTVSCASTNMKKEAVVSNAYEVSPIINGAVVPNSMVRNIDGVEVDLNKELQGKNTVLVFYRGGWCPYCNLQLQGLRKIEKNLNKLGWEIVGISPDSPASLKESISKNKLTYTLYSDSSANAAKAFGLAFRVDDKTNKKYLGYGINLDKASGESHHILPVPGVYLINSKGEIVFNYIHPNYKIRLKESIILNAAKELK